MPVSGSKISSSHWVRIPRICEIIYSPRKPHCYFKCLMNIVQAYVSNSNHIIVVICSTVQHRSQTYTYKIEYTCTLHWYNFHCNFRRVLPISTYIYMVRSIDKSQLCEMCIHWIYSVFRNISGTFVVYEFFSPQFHDHIFLSHSSRI